MLVDGGQCALCTLQGFSSLPSKFRKRKGKGQEKALTPRAKLTAIALAAKTSIALPCEINCDNSASKNSQTRNLKGKEQNLTWQIQSLISYTIKIQSLIQSLTFVNCRRDHLLFNDWITNRGLDSKIE